MGSPRPQPEWIRLPRLVGMAGLGVAVALAVTSGAEPPGAPDLELGWWQAWVGATALLLFAYPLTMLALWRNADHVPDLGPDGAERLDRRGRPTRRRLERRGSRHLFTSLALQSGSLVLLALTLLAALIRD